MRNGKKVSVDSEIPNQVDVSEVFKNLKGGETFRRNHRVPHFFMCFRPTDGSMTGGSGRE